MICRIKPGPETNAVTRELRDLYRTPRGMAVPKVQTPAQTRNRTLVSESKFFNDKRVAAVLAAAAVSSDI